jgi:Domain of unknown function (DUF1844)
VAEQEPERSFSVVDRRRRGEEESGAPPAAAPSSPPPPPRPEPRVPPADVPPQGTPRADFASFCVMLYSETLMHLGQVPDPVTGQPQQDLEQAQFTIDLLGMLQEKTEGNRSPQESAVLEEILANLRMAFVRASRRP